jgi:hypothetical protein
VRLIGSENSGTTFDFGHALITSNTPDEHVFRLHSADGKPVAIDRLQATCGCTSAVVADVDSATTGITADVSIRVNIDPARVSPGHIDKTVLVYVKGQAPPAAVLEMVGVLDAGVRFDPEMLSFGTVLAGVRTVRYVTVPLDPSIGGSAPDLMTTVPGLVVGRGESAAPGDAPNAYRYSVTLPENAFLGPLNGSLAISLRDAHGKPRLTNVSIPVVGTVKGAIDAAPNTIVFGVSAKGQRTVRQVTLTASESGVFRDLRIISNSPHVSARLLKPRSGDPGDTMQLETVLSQDAPAGTLSTQIIVQTLNGQQLLLPVYADIVDNR